MDPQTLRYAPTHEWAGLQGDFRTGSDPYAGGTTFQIAGGPWRDVGDEFEFREVFHEDLGFQTFVETCRTPSVTSGAKLSTMA